MTQDTPSTVGPGTERRIITLRIEHLINDYDTWKKAFDTVDDARAKAGVRHHTIRTPDNNPQSLMLDLDFDTTAAATAFAEFLENKIWSSPTSSPVLAGVPRTRILNILSSDTYQGPVPDKGPPTPVHQCRR